ncbi:hypothetical protein FNV43_RR16489 [Rhamnella rubrinervis]|uniref:Myb-like domain-containing protein n=1 Tax=Rhamnella rubrinervis TaxID=2594499 RepID=A0A8K0GYX5_9ROSA|nr:hypothetical protein FNV43_RR16489 [Rhamnella rubrinervis]
MDDDTSDSDSNLAWFWVIEALASFKEIGPSLLKELLEIAPKFDLGNNTKEMVALRCLEGLFARFDGNPNNVPSSQCSKIRLELSESCEDVLQQILQQISVSDLRMAGPELAKWDIQPFIEHKRASMPEYALKQLKDAILDGTHPYADFLGEKSGLAQKKGSDKTRVKDGSSISLKPNQSCADEKNLRVEGNSNPPILENRNEQLVLENGNEQLVLENGNEKLVRENGNEQLVLENGNEQLVLENGNEQSVLENRNEQSEENLQDEEILLSKRDRSNFATDDTASRENQDNINDSGDQHVNSKRMKLHASAFQLIEHNSVPLRERELLEDSTVRDFPVTEKEGHDLAENQAGTVEEGRVLEEVVCKEYALSKRCEESDGHDAFHDSQTEIRSNDVMMPQQTCGDKAQHNISVDEDLPNLVVDEGEHNLSVEEAKGDSEHFAEPRSASPADGSLYKISSKEEHNFAAQAPNPASPSVSQQNVIADEAQMLSDNDGYRDERVDVTMKKHDFLSCRYTVGQTSSEISDWTEQNLCMKCNEGGELLVCKSSSCPLVIHENCLGSSARLDDKSDFYCPFCVYSHAIMEYLGAKKKTSLVKKELAVFFRTGLEQLSTEFIEKLSEKEDYCTRESEDFLDNSHENEHLGQREEEVQGCPPARGHEEQPDQVLDNSGNVPCENSEMIVEHQEQDDIEIQQEVLKEHITNAPEEPSYETISDEETSEDDESVLSNYRVSIRRRGKQLTYPVTPQSRRQKISWTTAEEKQLMEGVERFSSADGGTIPWKKILEFGSSVFLKSRTTMDLKDKWRNLCKRTSTPK